MPYKRKYGTNKRRNVRRRRNIPKYRMRYRGPRRQAVPRIARYITPDTKLVKLKYCTDVFVQPATGGASAWVSIAANDVRAPGPVQILPASGAQSNVHQPMGFDQMMALYDTFYLGVPTCKLAVQPGALHSARPPARRQRSTKFARWASSSTLSKLAGSSRSRRSRARGADTHHRAP